VPAFPDAARRDYRTVFSDSSSDVVLYSFRLGCPRPSRAFGAAVWLLCQGKRRPDVVVRDTEPRSVCAELPFFADLPRRLGDRTASCDVRGCRTPGVDRGHRPAGYPDADIGHPRRRAFCAPRRRRRPFRVKAPAASADAPPALGRQRITVVRSGCGFSTHSSSRRPERALCTRNTWRPCSTYWRASSAVRRVIERRRSGTSLRSRRGSRATLTH
jgi:hypothetical protein